MQKKKNKKDIIFSKDFLDFFRILNKNKAEYMVIGGYAVSFYGYPRYTGDVDIWINNTPGNAQKIMKSLSDFGIPERLYKINDLISTEPMNGLYFGKEPFRIDIITSLKDMEFSKSYKTAVEMRISRTKIKVISKNNLIKNKSKTGRLKDLADIEEIKKSKK